MTNNEELQLLRPHSTEEYIQSQMLSELLIFTKVKISSRLHYNREGTTYLFEDEVITCSLNYISPLHFSEKRPVDH